MMNFQGAMSTIVLSRLKVISRQKRETEKYLNYEFKNTLITSRHSSSYSSLWTLPLSHLINVERQHRAVKRESLETGLNCFDEFHIGAVFI